MSVDRSPEINRLAVLRIVRQLDTFTRLDLVRRTGLSMPTVAAILGELEANNYVTVLGNAKPRGGRPPTLYRFQPSVRCAIGIEMRMPTISIGLVDMQGHLVDRLAYPFQDDSTPEGLLRGLEEGIASILASNSVDERHLTGIGMGVPGFVDRETGDWLIYPRLPQFRNIPLRQFLSDRFSVTVHIQNEANVFAMAELRYGQQPVGEDTVFITWSEGIKASIVIEGRMLTGRYNNFGTVGHFIVVDGGRPCYCGARGCLEMYASGYALRNAIQRKLPPDDDIHTFEPSMAQVRLFQRAEQGDAQCRAIVEEAVPYLASALASLARLTDINQFVLLGEFVHAGNYLVSLLHSGLTQRLPDILSHSLAIRCGGEHTTSTILCAAAIPVVEAHFEAATARLDHNSPIQERLRPRVIAGKEV